jgi:hypothetical protein
MPYVARKATFDEQGPSYAAGDSSAPVNPFLQFVDPAAYRQAVEHALSKTEAGRLVTPLSRVPHTKGGTAGLASAWDEELADDAA